MSADNFDSRFALGPNIFHNLDPRRISQLQTDVFMKLKVMVVRIFEMESDDEEWEWLYQDFAILLKRNINFCGPAFVDVSTKLFSRDNLSNQELVGDFQVLLYDKLESEKWDSKEILCVHCLEAGFFSPSAVGIREIEE